jgi:hypothetical protein
MSSEYYSVCAPAPGNFHPVIVFRLRKQQLSNFVTSRCPALYFLGYGWLYRPVDDLFKLILDQTLEQFFMRMERRFPQYKVCFSPHC